MLSLKSLARFFGTLLFQTTRILSRLTAGYISPSPEGVFWIVKVVSQGTPIPIPRIKEIIVKMTNIPMDCTPLSLGPEFRLLNSDSYGHEGIYCWE